MTVEKQETDSPSNDANLMELNDDCLLNILQYLTAKEIVVLIGQLTHRFDELARFQLSHIKKLKIQFSEGHSFTKKDLYLLGKNLISLHISAGYSIPCSEVEAILEPITQHGCESHLQDLTLNYVYMNENLLNCLIRVAENLITVDLSNCNLTDDLMERFFGKCCKLKNLVLLANYDFGGESLKFLHGMHSIVIEKHEKWSLNFDDMIEQNPKLYWTIHPKGRFTALVRS